MEELQYQATDLVGEPFPCPACGQMLAASCRRCVACGHIIDPAELARLAAPRAAAAYASRPEQAPSMPVRYPWSLFFAVLGISFLLAMVLERFLGEQKAQLAMGGIQTLAGIWVYFDALGRGIPRPLRWGAGTILLPIFIFPWYLGRRSQPQSPVPFVESEAGRFSRFLLLTLMVFFLLGAIVYEVQGPRGHGKDAPHIFTPR